MSASGDVPVEHAAQVRTLVSEEAARPDDQPAVGGRLQRLCRAAVRDLSARGVGISLLSDAGEPLTAAASGPPWEQVEELQFSLGEGPCVAAYAVRGPVLIADLAEAATRWPAWGPAAGKFGVRAVFAFPLQVGVSRLGALDVYRDQPGALSPWGVTRSLAYADAALQMMIDVEPDPDALGDVLTSRAGRLEVYQAQGMLMIQLGVTPGDALARMRAYAYLHDRPIEDVADDILARRIHLEKDGSGHDQST
jgi:hypothetical protein